MKMIERRNKFQEAVSAQMTYRGISREYAVRLVCQDRPELLGQHPKVSFENETSEDEKLRKLKLRRAVQIEIQQRGLDPVKDWNTAYRDVLLLHPELSPPAHEPDTAPPGFQQNFSGGMTPARSEQRDNLPPVENPKQRAARLGK